MRHCDVIFQKQINKQAPSVTLSLNATELQAPLCGYCLNTIK